LRLNELTQDLQKRSAGTESPNADRSARLRVEYRLAGAEATLQSGLLAAIRFGHTAAASADGPLCIDVQLQQLTPAAYSECWYASGAVTRGQAGSIRYACDAEHLFAVSELDEGAVGGVAAAAERIYAGMRRFQHQSGFPHLLRIWNYLDAINSGDGDQERYRQFCVGRSRGLDDANTASYPAATAVGQQRANGRLQVYWLATRTAGTFIENPRQVSAYRYPRSHGPVSPSFARATLARDGALLISGTASIVGHVSQHAGDPLAQLDETLHNLAALGAPVNGGDSKAPPTENTLLKVYVRDAGNVEAIAQKVSAAFPRSPALFLAADICRRELLLEIELVKLAV
jgi:chorismate lyase/3-hydroxybenzoate synthase